MVNDCPSIARNMTTPVTPANTPESTPVLAPANRVVEEVLEEIIREVERTEVTDAQLAEAGRRILQAGNRCLQS